MPLTLSMLREKLGGELAPNDPEKFRQLLEQADELLLSKGKWRWVREQIALTPVDGMLVLPDGYESIMGSRIGNYAKSVGWQEVEYLEDGPGFIPIQGDACEGRLIDQGLLNRLDGKLDYLIPTLELEGALRPGLSVNGLPSWSSTGAMLPFSINRWVKVSASATNWILQVFENKIPIATFTSLETVIDLPLPDAVTWDANDPAYGAATTALSSSLQRCYKFTGREAVEVTVLARFEARPIVEELDVPRCPSLRALKRAMYAILFEDAADAQKALEYEALAVQLLDEQEAAYRGAAKQIFKPSLFGSRMLRHRHTNRP